VVSLLALTAACALYIGLHPLTPARTFHAYETKATDTAESVLSSVETASLTADLASRHRIFGTYVSVLMSESDSGIGGAQSTFNGIQPPDARADQVRAELGDLMSRASDTVSKLRIRARRGETNTLAADAEPLRQLAKDLNAFIETHR
jgi:hypothetical protein